MTSPGATVGTAAYMSPEQARGEDLDARTDLFSFGAVLYEATGKRAFTGSTTALVHDSILNRVPSSAMHLNPASPPELEHIRQKALEKDCTTRYQGAAELRADLKRLRRETDSGRSSSRVDTASGFARPAARQVWWLSAAAVLLLAAAGTTVIPSPSYGAGAPGHTREARGSVIRTPPCPGAPCFFPGLY